MALPLQPDRDESLADVQDDRSGYRCLGGRGMCLDQIRDGFGQVLDVAPLATMVAGCIDAGGVLQRTSPRPPVHPAPKSARYAAARSPQRARTRV